METSDTGNGSSSATSGTAAGFASMSPFRIRLRLLFPPHILLPLHRSIKIYNMHCDLICNCNISEQSSRTLSMKALDEVQKGQNY
jgi:hypothetical protein